MRRMLPLLSLFTLAIWLTAIRTEIVRRRDSDWAEIETEASRTFKRHIAGRRVVDVSGPGGPVTAAISTGHLNDVAALGKK